MKKALIVDDTKNIRMMLTICLENEGYEVIAVQDGNTALLTLNNNHFDLVLLDIKMPGISGTDVLKQIRGMGLDMPVIIMTAFATVKNAIECTKLGAISYLQKPFTPDKVRSVLKELADYKTLDDNYYDVWKQKGCKLMIEERFEEALENFKKCLSIKPEDDELYNFLGTAYERLGKHNEAKRFYTAAELFRNK